MPSPSSSSPSVSSEHRDAVISRLQSLIRQRLWIMVSAREMPEMSPEWRQEIQKMQHLERLIVDADAWLFHPETPQEMNPGYPVNPQIELPMLEQVHYLSVEDRLMTLTEERIQSVIRSRNLTGPAWRQERARIQSLEMDIANAWDGLFRFPEAQSESQPVILMEI